MSAANSGVQVPARGLVDDANLPEASLAIAHSDGVMWIVRQIVGGAADRIDDPQRIGVDRHLLILRAFFGENGSRSKVAADDPDDRVLDVQRPADDRIARPLPR